MRHSSLWLSAALGIALTGCASLDHRSSHTHEVRGEYVAAVDKIAERRGVTVMWINPPTRQRPRVIEYETRVTVEREP